jgi:hypothetical protein
MDAEPRYLNFIKQFIDIFQQTNVWQEANEKLLYIPLSAHYPQPAKRLKRNSRIVLVLPS